MRRRLIWIGLMACAASACGSDDEDAPIAVASGTTAEPAAPVVAAPVVSAEPEHGGTVVVAGRYPVEVVPHSSGQVYAYVLGDPPPADGVELTIEVPVAGRSTGRPVRMRWNARRDRWEGRVRRVEIVEGPIDVLIVVGGVDYHGHVDICVLFPAIEVEIIEYRGKHKHKHKHKHRGRGHGRGHVIRIH